MTTLPAWHVKNQGYINAAGQWGRPQKNNWAFIWPKDKPNQTKWGRMGDILTGKGPDIFVASYVLLDLHCFWAISTKYCDP